MKKVILLTALLLQLSPALAQQSAWQLPLDVSTKNTNVGFDIETTWHAVHGKFKEVSGSISQSDPKNPQSIAVEIHFSVKSIDTGWGLRNDSLYENWEADKFPMAVFKSTRLEGFCTPAEATEKACHTKLSGTLTIRDITKEIQIDIKIGKKGDVFKANGSYSFAWADYGIKDPSIPISKVAPTVKVKYSTVLTAQEL